jgi:hypothetical protein
MTQIRSLFDPDKGIHRSIEKVISYQASQEERLKAEIREYIVTDSIEYQLERLLENIQAAMEAGGGHEVGSGSQAFTDLARARSRSISASPSTSAYRSTANPS